MTLSSAAAFAPATVANLGIGFDILGIAIEGLGDTVTATVTEAPGVTIQSITGDDGRLPREPERNTAGIAALAVLKLAQDQRGLTLDIDKRLPLSSGLGSSAASAVAGAAAANLALGEPLDQAGVLAAALEGEAAVSGYHADNIAPCLFGGFTLCYGLTAGEIVPLPVPDNLYLTLVTPEVAVPTAMARAVLPDQIPLKTMVAQTAGVARFVHALHTGDLEALAAAMESDRVVEPARAHLMPGLTEARRSAKANGALALVISGAGPTLMAISPSEDAADRVAEAIRTVYADIRLPAAVFVSTIRRQGAEARLTAR